MSEPAKQRGRGRPFEGRRRVFWYIAPQTITDVLGMISDDPEKNTPGKVVEHCVKETKGKKKK